MAGLTSVYGLPYQALTDPPHGPQLGQDLAEAVEAELARIDADVEAGDARLIGGKRYTTGGTMVSGVAGTDVATGMETGLVTLQPGRQYRFPVRVNCIASGAGTNYWFLLLRKTNAAGAVWAGWIFDTRQNTFSQNVEFTCVPPPVSVATTDTFVVTAKRLTGVDTLSVSRGGPTDPSYMLVEDLGPAERVTAA